MAETDTLSAPLPIVDIRNVSKTFWLGEQRIDALSGANLQIRKGEFICFDVHPFRTTTEERWLSHLANSRRTFEHLLAKARSYPEKEAAALIAARNYQDLDQLVLEHLMGVR